MEALGDLLKSARMRKKLSARKLAAQAGLTHSFIAKIEAAKHRGVSPDTLMALAQALDLPPEDLFTLAGYRLPDELPSFGPYLRARYGAELPEGARTALTELFDTLRRSYFGSDLVNDEVEEDEDEYAF